MGGCSHVKGQSVDLVLHLGAHKTASTYLQHRLAANAHVLSRHGITFVPPQEYRPAVHAAALPIRFLNNMHALRRQRRRHASYKLLAAAETRGHTRFVLSEENLIGNPDRLMRGSWFYDRARKEIEEIIGFTGQRPVQALLAIRNYADFYPSAYGEVLKLRGFMPFDDARRHRIVEQTRGWPDLVADVLAALPTGSRLSVWQHEAMASHEQQILEQFVGRTAAGDLDPLDDRPQQGVSARAIAHLHHVSARGARIGRKRLLRVIKENPKRKGHAAFDPWSAEERRHLNARYAADLRRIAVNWPEVLIHPPLRD